ncbi:MAG TPA: VWA domain-containing protein [Thermoanaerobaculia bacterium]|nr:VWA domain-containing protein [Thermoanaerobaculia bacterium]
MRALLLSLTLLTIVTAVHAQQPPQFGEIVDVRVTNIDVVVTDARGNGIHDLTAADFELYENGEKREITNFHEVRSSGPQEGTIATSRRIVLFFDDTSLSLPGRRQIVAAARDSLTSMLRPGDAVMIVSWNRSLAIRQPWNDDPATTRATLESMAKERLAPSPRDASKRRLEKEIRDALIDNEVASTAGGSISFGVLLSAAAAHAESAAVEVQQFSTAFGSFLETLRGVGGKKIVILAGESFATDPGRDLFQFLENARQQTLASSRPLPGSRNANPMAEASQYQKGALIESVGRAAAAQGLTIYAVNPQQPGQLSAGGVDQTRPTDQNVQFAVAGEESTGFQMLSGITGGLAILGARPAVAFSRIASDIGSYYSLGYRAATGPDIRRVEIRTTRDGLRLRTRSFVSVPPLEREMEDRVTANHFQAPHDNDLGISLQIAGVVSKVGPNRMAPLHVLIPADRLTLAPEQDGTHTGAFSVFICVGSPEGDVSPVNRQIHPLRWPPEAIKQAVGRHLTFAVEVGLEGRADQISVGVLDHRSGLSGFDRIAVGP